MTSGYEDSAFASEADSVIDARGLRCPLPVIRLAAHARAALTTEVVEVLATDPAARADIPAWCRLRQQEYLGAIDRRGDEGSGAHTAYRVRVSPAAPRRPRSAQADAAPPQADRGTPDG